MGEVVGINGDLVIATREPRQTLIETLEDALEKAKAGEIQGAVLVMRYADGCVQYVNSGAPGGYAVIGCLEDAKRALLTR